LKPRGLKINGKRKNIEWEKKLQDFEFYVKRSNKILNDLKSKEQLQQIPSIHNKLLKIFPSGTILKDINLIEKFLQISNSIRENYFDIEARELGRHLINSLMYLHGVAQTISKTTTIRLCNKVAYFITTPKNRVKGRRDNRFSKIPNLRVCQVSQ